MEGTAPGPNRTGGAINPKGVASMLEAVDELSPRKPVSTLLMDIERQWYITEAEAVGSIPPPISSPGSKGRKIKSNCMRGFLLWRAGARCPGFRVPITLRRQWPEMPAGAARRIAPTSLPAYGRAVSEARPLTRTRSAGCAPGAMFWGVFSLVTFSCTSKRKLPARPQDEWKHLPQKLKSRKLDSSLRWNDDSEPVTAPTEPGAGQTASAVQSPQTTPPR